MSDFQVHPSLFVCPNQCDVFKCCSQRPPFQPTPPPVGFYSPYSKPGTADYNVQMSKVWMGRPCWAPEGFQCQCPTYVLKNQ